MDDLLSFTQNAKLFSHASCEYIIIPIYIGLGILYFIDYCIIWSSDLAISVIRIVWLQEQNKKRNSLYTST